VLLKTPGSLCTSRYLNNLKICPIISYNLRYLYFSFGENRLWGLQKVTVTALLVVAFILSEQLQITLFNICFIWVSELILVLQQRHTCLMRIKIILNWILLWEFLSITQLCEWRKTSLQLWLTSPESLWVLYITFHKEM